MTEYVKKLFPFFSVISRQHVTVIMSRFFRIFHFCIFQRQEISVKMFEYLLITNNLHSSMKEYGLNVDGQNENDLVFIKEMIRGHLNTDETQDQVYISFCVKTVNSVLSIAVGFDVCAIRLCFFTVHGSNKGQALPL